MEDVEAYLEAEGLGPDPLQEGFTLREFRGVLSGRSGTVKGVLMNQKALAGLGNIYADELLYRAGVHPETKVDALDGETVKEIWNALKAVVDAAIEARVDAEAMPSTFLITHREEGAECPRCGGRVAKTEVSGRSTYYCPECQPEPSR